VERVGARGEKERERERERERGTHREGARDTETCEEEKPSDADR
jgi:hypothetical protein